MCLGVGRRAIPGGHAGRGKQLPLNVGAEALGFAAKRVGDTNRIERPERVAEMSIGVQSPGARKHSFR